MLGRRGFSLVIVMFILIVGSLQQIVNANSTTEFTPTPINLSDLRVFPRDLMCDVMPNTNNKGPMWHNITIGKSTVEDLKKHLEILSHDYISTYSNDGTLLFSLQNHDVAESDLPTSVGVCLNGETIEAIRIDSDTPFYLSDLINIYDLPEAVTWTSNDVTRIAFWFKYGIAAEVFVVSGDPNFGRIGSVIYFPYQEVKRYEERWPYNQTRKFNRFLVSPEDAISDFGSENPFDFKAMIATITAEPSRTPTPTFAALPLTPTVTATP